ncbi:MAG: sulfotransferase [Bacillota bacterium]
MQQQSQEPDGFEQAIALYGEGRLREAEAACHAALKAEPRQPHALHMLGLIRAEAGAVEEGLALVEQALATGVVHPAIQAAHGRLLLRLGRPAGAVPSLEQSLRLDPRQPPVLRLLGVALIQTGRAADAEALLRGALARLPEDPGLLDALAMSAMAQGRYAEARPLLERALELDPEQPDAAGNLALVYEQSNLLDEAAKIVEQGLERWPKHASLQLIEARLLRRRGDYAAGRERLLALQQRRELLPMLQRDSEFELGWCADGLGDFDKAMEHFGTAKELTLKFASPSPELRKAYPQLLAELTAILASRPAAVGTAEAPAGTPAFLLGFPRSGTTLLDTMLGAHGGFTVLEEQPAIRDMLDAYRAAGHAYPGTRLEPDAGTRARMREAYFEACRRAGWDGKRALLDKSPFATAHLGAIYAVFPGAPIVFLARHPCDVVLSCYMNAFELNSGTVHFTRLESTVDLYCGIMDLWRLYREKLPLNHLVVRYEDLVAAPEAELRRLLEFLKQPWSPAVLEYAEHALKRGRIPTPSYSQVSRPLYRHASGRWRNYSTYLEPYRARLAPYIEAFGYEP